MGPVEGMNRSDWLAIASKGLLGWMPCVGPIIAEVVGNLIPNQRLDRLSSFAEILEMKLESINQDLLKERFRDPSFVNFFEDGLVHAVKASSTERRERIATLVAHGMQAQNID